MPIWEQEEIFFDGDQFFQRLIADIDKAKETITIEMYIFNDDALGIQVADHLIKARQRGVKVKILVDGIGSYRFFEKLHGVFTQNQIPIKIYNPLPVYHPYFGKLNWQQKIQALWSRLGKLNSRDHRKIITIDESIFYGGSFNITSETTKYYSGIKWKDIGIRLQGEGVKLSVLNFKRLWKLKDYFRYRKSIKSLLRQKKLQTSVRLHHSIYSKRKFYTDLLRRVHKSEKQVWIMTPYFIPKRGFIRALGKAAKRGVDVKLLISSKSDVALFQSLQFFYYPYLLSKGVKIIHYSKSILHAKNFIIDDWNSIGSVNLNHRSLLHDLEVDIEVQNQSNKDLICLDFKNAAAEGLYLTIDHLKQRTLFDRLLSRLFFVFKYWF